MLPCFSFRILLKADAEILLSTTVSTRKIKRPCKPLKSMCVTNG